jgi:twitching motility protein PilI
MSASQRALSPAPGGVAGRRTRLRQYQTQLLERMQAARAQGGTRSSQLGLQIGAERYLLDLTQASEIIPVPPLCTVPLTQPWYLGLANIRGSLVGVIDLARYLQDDASLAGAIGPDSRVVTFAASLGFNCALLVSRVYGLRHGSEMEVAGDGQSGQRLVDAEGQAWIPLDLAALTQDPRFLQVGL